MVGLLRIHNVMSPVLFGFVLHGLAKTMVKEKESTSSVGMVEEVVFVHVEQGHYALRL